MYTWWDPYTPVQWATQKQETQLSFSYFESVAFIQWDYLDNNFVSKKILCWILSPNLLALHPLTLVIVRGKLETFK